MYNPPPADLPDRFPLIHTPGDSTICYRSHPMSKRAVFFGKAMAYRWDAARAYFPPLALSCTRDKRRLRQNPRAFA
jgi:hypothetical protein